MTLNIGDIFWLSVTYPDTGETEKRPVVIYGFVDNSPLVASFATITTSEINDFDGKYDKWKVPLFRWQSYGLKRASYVKVNCIATIDKGIFKSADYIGNIDKPTLKKINERINEFIDSDEDSW